MPKKEKKEPDDNSKPEPEPKKEKEEKEEKEFAIGILKNVKIHIQGKREIWQNIVDKLIGLQEDVVFIMDKSGLDNIQ